MSSAVVGAGAGVARSASAIVAQAVTGSHVLKIDGYSLTKRLRNGESIKSEPFDIGGHRWRIEYFPDGYNAEEAGSISFYLRLDHSNATVAVVGFAFSLLDDSGEPVPSYCFFNDNILTFKADASGWPGWGYPGFIERKVLEESSYLKDDCFRVMCVVTVCKEFRTESSLAAVTVPPSDMNKHIGRLLSLGVEADITFQVGEETFAAHRLVLAARSSVFMAELYGPMKEKGASHVRVDDMEPRVFKAMLHFIYNDALPEMDNGGDTFALAQHLLVAADRYCLERLKLMCEHKLCQCINTDMVTTTLVLAEQHGCKGLKEACFKFLKAPGHLKKISEGDEFKHLISSCPSLLSEVLANLCTLT